MKTEICLSESFGRHNLGLDVCKIWINKYNYGCVLVVTLMGNNEVVFICNCQVQK